MKKKRRIIFALGVLALLALVGALGLGQMRNPCAAAPALQEWWEACPPDPPTRTPWPPQPTYTPQPDIEPQPTYTPWPTPTCRATTTPAPNPSPTPYPTNTPPPTYTPYPTSTPYPTQPPPGSTATPVPQAAECDYYVSLGGDDINPGTSEDAPWQTLDRVHAQAFEPGNVVCFERGGRWAGGLVIDDSGTDGNPITFTAYGEGDAPLFTNPGSNDDWTNAVEIDASWVIVEGVLVRDAQAAGIEISSGAENNVIWDIEATDVGIGVSVDGQYNLITQNYIHDLHMVRNTADAADDDFGAVGVWLFNSHNEVSYNRMVNCKASSHDYMQDGGAVEWWAGSGVIEDSYVHHNWASGCEGFLEVGSNGGTVRDVTVAYNVSINNGWFAGFNLAGTFGTSVTGFRVENNAVYQVLPHGGWGAAHLFLFNADPALETLALRNNVFYVDGWSIANHAGFTHDHNLYYGYDALGFAPDVTEVLADPLFAGAAGYDFHLQADSPAIDAGADLGHALDYDGVSVPQGTAPDMGAFEYAP